jgi:ribosome-associated toxin RatA of RatAB toxin-antitoxin module
MTVIRREALIKYSPEQMFKLVDDVKAYPSFLQWCREAEELSREPDEVVARLELAWKGFHKSFTTRNRLQTNKIIEITLVNGPFKHLEGYWRFDELEDGGCKVTLDLEFEFNNRLLSMAFGKIFEQIANSLVEAFTKQAKNMYG